jgi:Lipoprotein LpqB beta-propeller domain/Sporulation and spore germination
VARQRALLRAAVAATAAAVLAAGCATVPTVGPPEAVSGSSGPAQQFVQPIPPEPNSSWSPQDMVQGFLAASANFPSPGKPAAALRFLAPELRKSWRPRWAVTVVAPGTKLTATPVGPATVQGAQTEVDTVSLTGQRLATISDIGQYLDQPGSQSYVFRLAKFHAQWLIIGLPRASALLTEADFEEVYQPRNLYFWSPASDQLVPEPVFAPQTDALPNVATNLVDALLKSNLEQGSWLATATSTAFPAGTTLLGVSIDGSNALVNLGGAASAATTLQLQRMAAQLVTTLTSTSYAQSPISQSVTLEINGQPQEVNGDQVQQPSDYEYLIPRFPAASQTLYYIGASGAVSELASGSRARVVPGPGGSAQIPFATIAVSPADPAELAGALGTGRGCVIYYGALASTAALDHRDLPDRSDGPCVSLSWDSSREIWAATAHRIWVLPPGARQPTQVVLPSLPGSDSQPYRILALRVALDGVRVAMLVQTQTGQREVLVTAATRADDQISLGPAITIGTSLSSPAALSWYDPDHLIVLAGSQLYEVPVNGGAPEAVGPGGSGSQVITSAGPGQIAVGGHGEILTSSGPNQIQQPAVKGTSPAYPG